LLSQKLEQAARSAVEATTATARETECAIAVRVYRLDALVDLLLAKAKASRAVSFASRKEFVHAEQQLEEAAELLQAAPGRLYTPTTRTTNSSIACATRFEMQAPQSARGRRPSAARSRPC
jgi:hypothetical protein